MGDKQRFTGSPEWKDKGFIFFFIIWFLATAGISMMGVSNGDWPSNDNNSTCTRTVSDGAGGTKTEDCSDETSSSSSSSSPSMVTLFAIIVVPLVVAIGFTWVWIKQLREHAEAIIKNSLKLVVALFFIFAVIMFLANPIMGIIFLVIACIYAWVVKSWWPRIPFVAVVLRNCCAVLLRYPSSLTLTYSWIFVQFLWFAIVVAMAVGLTGFSDGDSKINIGYGLLTVLALWGSNALVYIHHLTISGLVATWYFMDGSSGMPESPVKASFGRSTTTSLGTVLFGALVIAIIQIIHSAVTSQLDEMRKSANPGAQVCACILQCIADILKRAAEYFTKYLYVNVAIYGNGFVDAGKETYALFKRAGLSNLIGDLIIDKIQFTGQLFSGLLSAVVCGGVGFALSDSDNRLAYILIFALVGLIVGMVMAGIGLTAVDSSVKALFVCLAEEPHVLQENSPELYEELRAKGEAGGVACFRGDYRA